MFQKKKARILLMRFGNSNIQPRMMLHSLATDVHQLFELLADREIDIALEAQLTGQPELEHFPNRGLVMLLDTVEYFPVFHFLNKKHANLVVPLSEEIQKMKQRGEIYQIFKDYYQTVTPSHN